MESGYSITNMNKYVNLIDKEIEKLNSREVEFLNLNESDDQIDKVKPSSKIDNVIKTSIIKITKGIKLKSIEKKYKHNLKALKKEVNYNNITAFDKDSKKLYEKGKDFTYKEGLILGAFGIGIPDLPIFLSILLRNMYSLAAIYGFNYKSEFERIYLLKLLQASLSKGSKRKIYFNELDELLLTKDASNIDINELTKLITKELLAAKLIQGVLIGGAVGGFTNRNTYTKVMRAARYKYRQRFLYKLKEIVK